MRYHSKVELVDDIGREHAALTTALGGIPDGRFTEAGVWGDGWNVCDLVAHLAEWHRIFLRWFEEGRAGAVPALPAPGYKWHETPRLNRAIQEKHRGRTPANVRKEFEATHEAVLSLVRSLSEAEIFEPGAFAWTGKNALVTYVGANTASHYRFARKVLRRWERNTRSPEREP